ncbi:MAG: hypothetical protein M9894_33525 [Planctomycetes bacterium]|nr:hypothetical protein [Planctomycetota bacterium]
MTRAALLGPLLALLLVGGPAGAQAEPAPALREVEVGFGGTVDPSTPAHVWVTVDNPGPRPTAVRVVARSRRASVERALQLPPGGRRRVPLALAIDAEVALLLRDDDRTLDEHVLHADQVDPARHLLVLDGRPAALRPAADPAQDPLLHATTIDAAAAPTEAACYDAVAAVLLRADAPAAWSPDQREALLEWVRAGGLLLVAEAGPRAPGAARFFDDLPAGDAEPQKRVGRLARERRLGFGRALAFADDPLRAAALDADVRQRLGQLLADARATREWPLQQLDDARQRPFEGAAAPTQLLVGGFFCAYALAVGPALALALRRAGRRRLAWATCALVLGFTLLAPVVAAAVRAGAGEVRQRAVLWVPAPGGGPAFELGELLLTSGGGTDHRLELEEPGGRAVAATALEQVDESRRRPTRVTALRTARGPQVTLEASVPPWGAQRLRTHTLRPDVRPVAATLAPGVDPVVTVVNTSGTTLARATLVLDDDRTLTHVPLGDLPPGAQREVALSTARRRLDLPEALGIPWDWQAWRRPRLPGGREEREPTRVRLVSRVAPATRVAGPRLRVMADGLRIDAVVPAPRGR